jgi:hypothetical protein
MSKHNESGQSGKNRGAQARVFTGFPGNPDSPDIFIAVEKTNSGSASQGSAYARGPKNSESGRGIGETGEASKYGPSRAPMGFRKSGQTPAGLIHCLKARRASRVRCRPRAMGQTPASLAAGLIRAAHPLIFDQHRHRGVLPLLAGDYRPLSIPTFSSALVLATRSQQITLEAKGKTS